MQHPALPRSLTSICLALIILSMAGMLFPTPVLAAPPLPDISVYYAGPDGGVKTALDLAGFSLATDPAEARVLVLNGVIPDADALAGLVREGTGLVLILGPEITAVDAGALLGEPVTLAPASEPLSLDRADGAANLLVSEILWNSAPQVRERSTIAGAGLMPLAAGFDTGEQPRPGRIRFYLPTTRAHRCRTRPSGLSSLRCWGSSWPPRRSRSCWCGATACATRRQLTR